MEIVHLVPAAIGILFIVVGGFHGYKLRKLTRRCTEAATGTVIGFKKKKLKSGELLYPMISYTVGRNTYMGQYSIGDAKWNMAKGDTIDIRYNPADPKQIYLYKQQSRMQEYASPFFIIIGGLLFIIAYYKSM
jgi:hypothetical protein